MAFKRASGKSKLMPFPKSATFTSVVTGDTNGKSGLPCQLSTAGQVDRWASDTAAGLLGFVRDIVAATDTSTNQVLVEVPIELFVEFEFDTDSDGGLADSDVGRYVDVDTNGLVDVSTSTEDTILVTKKISATKGRGVVARSPQLKAGGVTASTIA